MKRTYGESIKQLLDENKISQKELAAAINVSNAAVSSWINNTRKPGYKVTERLCSYFGVDINFLSGISENKVSNVYSDENCVRIPFYFDPVDFINGNNSYEYVSVPAVILDANCIYFAIVCNDSCLCGAGINHGDLMIFNKSRKIMNNEIGCFVVHNSLVCRKYYHNKNSYCLQSVDKDSSQIKCKDIDCRGVLSAHLSFKF